MKQKKKINIIKVRRKTHIKRIPIRIKNKTQKKIRNKIKKRRIPIRLKNIIHRKIFLIRMKCGI